MTRITIFITVLILVLAGCSAEDGATPDATSDSRTSATDTVSPSPASQPAQTPSTMASTEVPATLTPIPEPTPSPTSQKSDSLDAVMDADWATYENTETGFSIRHPSHWQVNPISGGGVTLASEDISSLPELTNPEETIIVSVFPGIKDVSSERSMVLVGKQQYVGGISFVGVNQTSIDISYDVAGTTWHINGTFGRWISLGDPEAAIFFAMVDTLSHDESVNVAAPDVPADPVPTAEPIVPLSPAYSNPDLAARQAMRELTGNPSHTGGIIASGSYPYDLCALYHLATADVGSFNADTTDFYPWLFDYISVWSGEAEPSGRYLMDRDELREHVRMQIFIALNEPESEIGRRIRTIEAGVDPLFGEQGPQVYWWYLIGAQGAMFPPDTKRNMETGFARTIDEYETAMVFGAVEGDFAAFLRESEFLAVWGLEE